MLTWQSVIIVEDVYEIAEACAHALELVGSEVRIARSVEEAADAALEFPPDAIVTTARLLDGEYLSFRAAIEDVCSDEHVPIVVLSDDMIVRDARTAAWSMFDADEVVAAVAHAIGRQQDATWTGRSVYAGRYAELLDSQPGAYV